jgi:hypothetical protein
MSLHFTVVGFGKQPTITSDTLLQYMAYDPEVANRVVEGKLEYFEVRTKVEGVQVMHIAVRDSNINSENLCLVFEQPFPAERAEDAAWIDARTYTMGILLGETISRCGGELHGVEGLLEDKFGNAGYCISGVGERLEADLAKAQVFLQG